MGLLFLTIPLYPCFFYVFPLHPWPMTPAARIAAVIEILTRMEDRSIPMDGIVGDYMRHRRYIGAKDRAAIVERAYDIVRAHARLGWWLGQAGDMDTPRLRVMAALCLCDGMTDAHIADLFTGGKFSPAPLDVVECAALACWSGKTLDHPDMPEAVRVECPAVFEAELRALYGDDFAVEMQAMQGSAPLDLRVNVMAHDRDAVQESLLKDGVATDPTPYSPWGLRARDKVFLSKTKAFTKGHIEIQDEGSQLIALLCAAHPGAQVLDYCAGAGGKTLALANMMLNGKAPKGRIVAMDIDPARLEKARTRIRRAHISDIVELRPLSDEKHRKWLKRQKQTFEIALVDAPCSGTGTWRRNPDSRWRRFGPDLDELVATQAEILNRVAATVKPGGRLVYATCSILRRENEDQVEAFLSAHPDFSLLPPAQAFADGVTPPPGCETMMRLSPSRHNTDGFFAAVLVRAA